VEYEWDANKERTNVRKHGISFQAAIEIFAHSPFTFPDERRYYGEQRKISIGIMDDGITLAVVHTERGAKTRVISARPANRKERMIYYEFRKKKS